MEDLTLNDNANNCSNEANVLVPPPTNGADRIMRDTTDGDDGLDNNEQTLPDPNELRLAANAQFAANALEEALAIYGLAVDVARKQTCNGGKDAGGGGGGIDDGDFQEPDLVIHLCNRSACFYRMEMYQEAKADALEAVALSRGELS